jgi:hypothetical protein
MEASRLFAILCHSRIYQPTVRNTILTGLTWIRSLLLHPRIAWPGVSKAIHAYRGRRREFDRFVNERAALARVEPPASVSRDARPGVP